MFVSILIFIVVYALLIMEKMNKAVAAILGAMIYLLFHFIPFEKAVEHIDMNVIFLLIGMMMIVKITEGSGVFEYIAIKSAKLVNANPVAFLAVLFVITAFFSGMLDNVTTVLLISPIVLLLATQMEIGALPFVITVILASNIGGTATLIGDPPNIMIGSAAGLNFMDFLLNLAPAILIISAVNMGILILIFRKGLVVTELNKRRIMAMDEKRMISNPVLMRKSLIVIAAVIAGFLLNGLLGTEPSVIALAGAFFLVLWTKEDLEEILKKIEWDTILFFIGLFIMVGVLQYTGVIDKLAKLMTDMTKGDLRKTSTVLLFGSGILSGILDNIPLVATFIPVVKIIGTTTSAHAIQPIWWSLALGSCLGGNGTLVGASANVIMFGFARKNNIPLSFKGYLAYGIPMTLLTLVLSYVYISFRYY
ncbi:ArsB/NhaD family transporter [Sphaerochaeta sp. PS]|uniref:SLC13 family permease n=1 Tax=Sphaerochaeta sp. PS TaxID=3076336 RepID=UPI0028A43DE4|nr:ArsB/NhaD family transporter [Sphaerochaeta sp. PS]MDT4762000.1 ArsB/NhaD family transporter [Sphaerochaeta sp. PS]